jgi:uncharacterized protein YndB with AHSA1/START domain
MTDKPVGLTKDVGYEIGVRRTLPIDLKAAWKLITSEEAVSLWLGNPADIDFSKGAEYELSDSSQGEVRVFEPNSHLRITWQPQGWQHASLIQVRVMPAKTGTTISFHQEHLPGSAEREQRRLHFEAVLDKLEAMID